MRYHICGVPHEPTETKRKKHNPIKFDNNDSNIVIVICPGPPQANRTAMTHKNPYGEQ